MGASHRHALQWTSWSVSEQQDLAYFHFEGNERQTRELAPLSSFLFPRPCTTSKVRSVSESRERVEYTRDKLSSHCLTDGTTLREAWSPGTVVRVTRWSHPPHYHPPHCHPSHCYPPHCHPSHSYPAHCHSPGCHPPDVTLHAITGTFS